MKAYVKFLMAILILGSSLQRVSAQQTEVLVLPALHGLHKSNPNYTYTDLYNIVRSFDPDVIGIEVRPEEMALGSKELDELYPLEMVMIRDSFPDRSFGIDYFGEEFEGRVLTAEAFGDSTNEIGGFLNVQRKLGKDSLVQKQMAAAGLDSLQALQYEMVSTASANEMMSGRFDTLSDLYYERLYDILDGTAYAGFTELNLARDKKITENALDLIASAEGKRVLILIGGNHRSRLVKALQGKDVRLIEQWDEAK